MSRSLTFSIASAIEPGTFDWRGVRTVHDASRGVHVIIDGGAARLPFGEEADVVERALHAFLESGPTPGLDSLDALVRSLHRAVRDAHRDASLTDDDLAFSIGLSIVIAWVEELGVSIAHCGRGRAYQVRSRGGMPERLTLDQTARARWVTEQLLEGFPLDVVIATLGTDRIDRVDLCRVIPSPGDALVLTSPIADPGMTSLSTRPDPLLRIEPDALARRIAVRGQVESARVSNGHTRGAAAIVLVARDPASEGPYR